MENQNKTIRIAQILSTAVNGGVESLIMNYYENIDRSKVQFVFFVESSSKIINIDRIRSLGGNVIIIPHYSHILKYLKCLESEFKKNRYDIVQSNLNSLNVFALFAAKKAQISIRISNSLSTSSRNEGLKFFVKEILRKFSKRYATHFFACSDVAKDWLFEKNFNNKNYFKIYNAVDFSRFKYNVDKRIYLRNKLFLNDKIVVGNIGRLEDQKNQFFTIEVFSKLYKKNNKYFLLIIGDGSLKKKLMLKVNELGIFNSVMFLSDCDVQKYGKTGDFYSAMDLFLLTSIYEGLPMVGIEAQISGLTCFFSSSITTETKISDKVFFISLNDSAEYWCDFIASKEYSNRDLISSKNYDIVEQAKRLEELYEFIMKGD